jgi:hypothetical protein
VHLLEPSQQHFEEGLSVELLFGALGDSIKVKSFLIKQLLEAGSRRQLTKTDRSPLRKLASFCDELKVEFFDLFVLVLHGHQSDNALVQHFLKVGHFFFKGLALWVLLRVLVPRSLQGLQVVYLALEQLDPFV